MKHAKATHKDKRPILTGQMGDKTRDYTHWARIVSAKKKLQGAIAIGVPLGAMGREGETNQSPIKRIYCSANSTGLDFHFNEITGQIYSYDKNNKLLIPFNIREELPFSDFYPKEESGEITQASKFINAMTNIKKITL